MLNEIVLRIGLCEASEIVAACGESSRWGIGSARGRPGVFELRDQDERAWYRVIYLSRVRDLIHVLHCFEKRSRETPMKELNTARQRLRVIRARMIQEKKRGSE